MKILLILLIMYSILIQQFKYLNFTSNEYSLDYISNPDKDSFEKLLNLKTHLQILPRSDS